MADNTSERKKDSTSEGAVCVKQLSADNEVIGLSHNPPKSPKKEEKGRRTRTSSSSPCKKSLRRKNHKNKKYRRHYTSSSSSTSSPSSGFPSPTPVNALSNRRFQIITEEEKLQYSIPGDKGKYVNKVLIAFYQTKI